MPDTRPADDFAETLAAVARAAAQSGSGRFDDVVIPGLGEKWPAYVTDDRLAFDAIGQALTPTPVGRAKLFDAGMHLSLYFMRVRDEPSSFASLAMAQRAMQAADASELAGLLPSLCSLARIAIEQLAPDDIAHYALGRLLGATARHMCAAAAEPVKRRWLAATSITLSAYGGRSRPLSAGFREMSGDAGYAVEILNFDVPDAGASFASALLDHDGADAGFAHHALMRFSALKDR